ncbi:MAG TPA: magnesium transporter [Vicinamibacterales bacterium]|nr:magnesium transporter [Vicinamibacterales bacterium]
MYEILIDHIREALGQHARAIDTRQVQSLVDGLHASDVAFVLDELTLPEAERVFAILDDGRAAEALVHVAAATRRHLLQTLPTLRAATLLHRLPMDEAAAVVADAPSDGARLLALLPVTAAIDVEQLLEHPTGTAGRLMTTKFVGVPLGLTVARAWDYVRAVATSVETVNVIYVLDAARGPAGVCSIRDLLVADAQQPIDAVMRRDVISVPADADQQDVARIIGRYDLPAVPVVDANGRMLGIVTIDDVLDVLTDEFNEDIAGLVGSDAAEMDRRSPAQIARLRLPWLLGTMAIELCAGAIIARFDALLRQVILLASFMPVISAVSGNVGLQAAAIVVRGLDTGHVSVQKWGEALRREVLTALSIALVAGSVLAAIAIFWSRRWPFGVVVGASMTCAVVAASVMGTLIPMLSKRLGFDPAATAGPFETAFQDVVGFTVFLWMATALARWLA